MIVGISGKKGHGKDTVANVIMLLEECGGEHTDQEILAQIHALERRDYEIVTDWEVHRFADALKDCVCRLLNCTREQLEDRVFKETPIEGWTCWKCHCTTSDHTYEYDMFNSYEKAVEFGQSDYISYTVEEIRLTPRLILQLLGTDGMRDVIHPDIHVLALMKEYVAYEVQGLARRDGTVLREEGMKYPKWLVPDVRFPNEGQIIKDKGGILIRIERDGMGTSDTHPSETGLDQWEDWDAKIHNTGNLLQLIAMVRVIYNDRIA